MCWQKVRVDIVGIFFSLACHISFLSPSLSGRRSNLRGPFCDNVGLFSVAGRPIDLNNNRTRV